MITVRCNDNKLYRNPVWRDPDNNWFICFDDDEPVEFVGVRKSGQGTTECEAICRQILDKLGFVATIRTKSYQGGGLSRVFTPRGDSIKSSNIKQAFAFFLTVIEAPPPPNEYEDVGLNRL